MNQIFIRDIIIALLLSVITSILMKEPCLACCLPIPWLFCVIGVEECCERFLRCVYMRRFVKKLRNRKVLPPTKARQD